MSKKSTLKKKKISLLIIVVVVGILFLNFGTDLFNVYSYETPLIPLKSINTIEGHTCTWESSAIIDWDWLERNNPYGNGFSVTSGGLGLQYYSVYDIRYVRDDNNDIVKEYLLSAPSNGYTYQSPRLNLQDYPNGYRWEYNMYTCIPGETPDFNVPVFEIVFGCTREGDVAKFGEEYFICKDEVWKEVGYLLAIDDEAILRLQATLLEKAEIIESLNLDIDKEAELIKSLRLNIDDQIIIIDKLKLTLDEKKIMVSNLELNISDQAEMINSLTTNLQEKADLVSQLQVNNEYQAELISLMNLSFSDQADIINGLNQEISDDAEIINNLNLSFNDQAEIIGEMELTIQEEGELVANLELSLSEEQQIVEELRVTIADQQDLIDSLNNEKLALEKATEDQLRLNIIYIVSFVVVIIGLLVFYFLTKKKKRGRR